jgi:hypothetical protein
MKEKKTVDTFVIPAETGDRQACQTAIRSFQDIVYNLDRSLTPFAPSRRRGNDDPFLFYACSQYLFPVFNVNTNESKIIIMIQQ